ncbi:MAG: SAM-dependent methyltransferase [Chitinophagales bacterium]|nr:SAM-dependent methyltransferase [Chitinophagales bacterium]
MIQKAKLYLIPSFLGEENPAIIPEQVKEAVSNLTEFIVEDARSARRFLRAIGYRKNFDTEVTMRELDKHAPRQNCSGLLQNVLNGINCGIISEAGNPCIADPGNELVAYAHAQDIEVIPLVGPSSILLALIASGFNGQQFTFNGYLPIKQPERNRKIKQLENASHNATQLFMETPFRNQKMLDDLLQTCNDTTRLCIACDLTLPTQFIKTKTIKAWKQQKPQLHKRYCIFLLG